MASLAGRLVLATLGFCLVFSLLVISLRTWSAWQIGLTEMNSELALIEKVYQRTLSKAIWEMDPESLQTHLDSAANVKVVGQIVIKVTSTEQKWKELSHTQLTRIQPGWALSTLAPMRKVVLTYDAFEGAEKEAVGELFLYGDERLLWSRLRAEISSIVITQIVQTLLLTGLIMLMFNRSVTVHVQRMARHFEQLTPETLGQLLTLKRRQSRPDELTLLESGVNRLQKNLLDYLQQQQRYESELATHRDHLAELVAERTAELLAANGSLGEANNALAESADTLRQIGDIGKDLTISLDRAAICEALHRHLETLLPLDGFGVAVPDADGDRLDLIYLAQDGVAIAPTSVLLSDTLSPVVRAYRNDDEWLVMDEAQIAQAKNPAGVRPRRPIRSAVLRALVANGQPIGVVMVYSHSTDAYGNRELDVLQSTATYASIALMNASAYAAAEAARQQAANALDDLRQAQGQLIQSEKMAALGQLTAGVAHEINSPISAVKSSGENIAAELGGLLVSLPKVFLKLAPQEISLFLKLVNRANEPMAVLSSREERAIVRETTQQLEEASIADAPSKAGILVQLNAHSGIAEYSPLLRHAECDLILGAAQGVATVISSTNNINTAVDRVAKIVFALKSLSRVDVTSQWVEAQLSDGMETVLIIYQGQIKQGAELVRHYETIAPLSCLPDELNQVWTNLIHNALQAMNHKGTLTVSIRSAGDEAVVSIGDTGCGIPEAMRGKIFDAFFTTKPAGEGSGLGLDIVKKIVDKHHGRIEVESTVNVGTTFSVYLPFKPAPALTA